MKKRKTKEKEELKDEVPKQNPVAKFAARFNKAKVIDDKSTYKRKGKHTKQLDSAPEQD